MAKGQRAQVQEYSNEVESLLSDAAVNIGALTGGLVRQFDPRSLADEALSEAYNCVYINGQLFLGRPGFVKYAGSALPGPIVSATKSIGGYLFAATASNVYRYSGTSFSHLFATEGQPTLLTYKGSLFCLDGGPIKRWDGTSIWTCGSLYDGYGSFMLFEAGNALTIDSTYKAVGVKLDQSDYNRRLAGFRCYLKGSGLGSGSLEARLMSGTNTIEAISKTKLPLNAIPGEFTEFAFFFDNVKMTANTTYYVVLYSSITSGTITLAASDPSAGKSVSGGSGAKWNGSSWTIYSGANSVAVYCQVNWSGRPRPTHGIVCQSRLFLAEGSKIWFSGPNDEEDWGYAGGFFTFGDDESSLVTSMIFWNDRLYVSGYTRGYWQTLLYLISPITALAEDDFFPIGAANDRGIVVADEMLTILGDGWIGARKEGVLGERLLLDVGAHVFSPSELTGASTIALYRRRGWLFVLPQVGTDIYVMFLLRGSAQALGGPWTCFRLPFQVSGLFEIDGEIHVASLGGHLFKLSEDATTDDGTAIKASVKTKEFFLGSLARRKLVRLVRVEHGGIDSMSLSEGDQEQTFTLPANSRSVNVRTHFPCRTVSISFTSSKRAWLGQISIEFRVMGYEPAR